jgi:prophage antirepressor-like protein
MNQVIPFNFENHAVRTVVLDETPWWVGRDVCEVLGYERPLRAIKLHCHGAPKWSPIVDALGRTQKARIINIGDVFRLIASCNLPEGERFESWIFDTVLPEIASTGAWLPEGMMAVPIKWFEALEAKIEKLSEIVSENTQLREENERLNRRFTCTPDDRREILYLHKDGFNVSQIAYKTKKGKTRIKKVIAEAEIESQPGLFDDEPSESFGEPLEAPRGYDGGGQ